MCSVRVLGKGNGWKWIYSVFACSVCLTRRPWFHIICFIICACCMSFFCGVMNKYPAAALQSKQSTRDQAGCACTMCFPVYAPGPKSTFSQACFHKLWFGSEPSIGFGELRGIQRAGIVWPGCTHSLSVIYYFIFWEMSLDISLLFLHKFIWIILLC